MVLIRNFGLDPVGDGSFMVYAVTDDQRTFRTKWTPSPGSSISVDGLSTQTGDDWASSGFWSDELVNGEWKSLQAPPTKPPVTLILLPPGIEETWAGITKSLGGPWACPKCEENTVYLDASPNIATCVSCSRVYKTEF